MSISMEMAMKMSVMQLRGQAGDAIQGPRARGPVWYLALGTWLGLSGLQEVARSMLIEGQAGSMGAPVVAAGRGWQGQEGLI